MLADLIKNLQTKIATSEYEVVSEAATEGYTAYALHTLLNETYEVLGIRNPKTGDVKKVPPQFLYNLAANGQIDGVKVKSVKGVRYSEAVAEKFITKMVTRSLREAQPSVDSTLSVDESVNATQSVDETEQEKTADELELELADNADEVGSEA